MSVFFTLLDKMLPLYGLVVLGYIAGKYLKVQKDSVAVLLIYVIVPVVVFMAVATTKINSATIGIPLVFFLICCFMSVVTYYLAGFIWKDATRNIVGFIAGSANSGYFGLPVAVALFGSSAVAPVALTVIGTSIYNNSFGFYMVARGRHTTKESLEKLLKLPVLYTFVAGVIASYAGLHFNATYTSIATDFNGAFIVLGMMLVGMGLADIKKFEFDLKFLSVSLIAKFAIWPLVTIGLLALDSHTLKIFDPSIHKILILMAIVPVAANTVSYATVLKTEPEKASLAVFISTLFALFYVPAIAALYF